ncbi:MAG: flagellar basal body rod C-terminal domain-containing protein [Rhodocyclaceae bacterium]
MDQIKVVLPADLKLLQFAGSELFSADGALNDAGAGQYRVMQGHLEGSNVNSAGEMIKLVELVKHIEANQRVLQYQDEMLGKSLGKFAEI